MNILHRSDNVAVLSSGVMITHGNAGESIATMVKASPDPLPGTQDKMGEIAMWGTDNLLPQQMALDIENTGILTAAIETKSRIAIGKGPMPCKVVGTTNEGYELLEFINDAEINAWMEENNSFKSSIHTMADLFGLGNAFQQFITSPNRDYIIGYKRTDPCTARFEHINPNTGRIDNVRLSGDWGQYSNSNADKGDKHYDKVPLLDRQFPYWDFQSRTKGNRFMLAIQYRLTGRNFYAPSPWYCARRYVKIVQGIPEMKEAMFSNQMTIKYLVEIHDKFWPSYNAKWELANADERKRIQESFYKDLDEYLTGGNNAYKSLIIPAVFDPIAKEMVPAVKITTVEDKIKDGKHIVDAAAANIEILLPYMINASLMGVNFPGSGMGGGAGSGSDIRESYLVQIMLLEQERRENNTIFDIVKKVNGWEKKHGPIVFRYPNQMLTTLNTGKNTQPTA